MIIIIAGNLEAAHAGRVTLMPSDLRIVREVVGVMSETGALEVKECQAREYNEKKAKQQAKQQAKRQAKRARHQPPPHNTPLPDDASSGDDTTRQVVLQL